MKKWNVTFLWRILLTVLLIVLSVVVYYITRSIIAEYAAYIFGIAGALQILIAAILGAIDDIKGDR